MTTALRRCVLSSALVLAAVATADEPERSFGQKDPGLYNLKGTVYFLPENTEQLPEDFSKLKPQGTLYTDRLDVPPRSFTEGFPGVTNRFEWFALDFTGAFSVDKAGTYGWELMSDDGARLWIDGKLVLNNDGVHGPGSVSGEAELQPGAHRIRVAYFQGPAEHVALQLFVVPPGAEQRVFVVSDFAKGLKDAVKKLNAEATAEGIRVKLDAAILFDSGKSVLKPEAQAALDAVAEVLRGSPGASVLVEGFTDSQGKDAANLELSRQRAEAVKKALGTRDLAGAKLETKGWGRQKPVASNDTEAGRAQNRRVEVLVRP